MTGDTHRAGGMLISVVGFLFLRSKGLLLPDVNEGLQFLVIYPFTLWGSTASDLDHHKDSCPSHDLLSKGVNRVLHLTTPVRSTGRKQGILYHASGIFDAHHRSWQTHSDLTLVSIILILSLFLSNRFFLPMTSVDISILSLVMTGICFGVIAHFILDILTPQGVWFIGGVCINKLLSFVCKKKKCILPEKIHLVPHNKFFATGGKWESCICKLLHVATFISVVYVIGLLFPNLIPYDIIFT